MVNKARMLIGIAEGIAKEKMDEVLDIFQKDIENTKMINEFKDRNFGYESDRLTRSLPIRYRFSEYTNVIKVIFLYAEGTYKLEVHDDRAMSSKQKIIFHQAKIKIEEFINKLNHHG